MCIVLNCEKGEKTPIEVYIGLSNFHFQDMPPQSLILPDGAPVLRCKAELKQDLNQLVQTMISETKIQQSGQYFMIKAYMVQMLVLLLRQIYGEEKQENHGFVFESRSKGYVVKRIIAYMNENYASHISLDQVAANMYLSPVYISKIFKEETGESADSIFDKNPAGKGKGNIRKRKLRKCAQCIAGCGI